MRRIILSAAAGLAALIAAGDAHAGPKPPKRDREHKHQGHGDFRGGPKGHGQWKHHGYSGHPTFDAGRHYIGVHPSFAVSVYGSVAVPRPYLSPVCEATPAYAPPVYQAPAYLPPAYQPAPVYAPPAVAAPADPAGLVREWYRRYLGREGDPGGVATWVDSLRQGNPPDVVLATILASDEYYGRAGGSPEGLVQRLFADLTGRQPAGEEYGYWLDRISRGHWVDVIRDLLLRYPQP